MLKFSGILLFLVTLFTVNDPNTAYIAFDNNGLLFKDEPVLKFGSTIEETRKYLGENYQTHLTSDTTVDSYFDGQLSLKFTKNGLFDSVFVDSSSDGKLEKVKHKNIWYWVLERK